MSAIRLARGYTGRDKIVKFEGCYHGHSDSLLVKAGSGALTLGVPPLLACPRRWRRTPSRSAITTSSKTRTLFKSLGEQIACIIVEPIAGNMNCVPPVPCFLENPANAVQ